jgi:alkylation response protein AidB-like acyl-CoA dehydrogenase
MDNLRFSFEPFFITEDENLYKLRNFDYGQLAAEDLYEFFSPPSFDAARITIAGASRTALDLARTHAVEREQFGRSVSKFQAVRHRLAETLVAIEALDATLGAAWDEPGAMTAALASAQAGRTARVVAAHCQQVLAGIGFTTDHPFHRYLKRTMALEGLFGTTDEIVVDLGRQLLEARNVPRLIEL